MCAKSEGARWRAPSRHPANWLLVSIYARLGGLVRLQHVRLAGAQGLLDPVLRLLYIGLTCIVVAALDLRLTAIGKVEIRHSILVGGPEVDCLMQRFHRLVDQRAIRGCKLRALFFGYG